jgi:hypothetical protein
VLEVSGDVGASAAGAAGGAAAGAGADAVGDAFFGGALGFGALGFEVLGFGAAFLAAALALGFALGAALTAFLATLGAPPVFLALLLAFAGRVFFFATLFLAAWRLAFATGRFFDLLFFAMVTLLLEIVRTRCESSPEKVRCHLRVMLESVTRIA